MASAVWGKVGSSSSSNGSSASSSSGSSSGGLCVIGTACRFGSSRDSTSEEDCRLIKIEVEGEEVLVDRYDVRLLLGDVASFARQNCSEERRLAELQESPEIEDMRYEDLPRRSAFSDELPSQQQQQEEQQQWTPTLEQQQKQRKKQRTMTAVGVSAAQLGDGAPTAEGFGCGVHACAVSSPDYSAVPPPDSLEAASANQTASSVTEEREHGVTAATGAEKEEAARGTLPERSGSGATFVNVHVDEFSHQNRQQPGEQDEQQQGQRQQQEQSNSCFVPPFPDLPADMCLPENIREYLVVERTAHFVREEGERMEFRLLLDEERRLPFLSSKHRLHPFYTWLKKHGYSLVTRGAALLPLRIRAMLEFAYSLGCAADLHKQQQQQQHQPQNQTAEVKREGGEIQLQLQQNQQLPSEKEQTPHPHQEQEQPQQQPKHDLDGGLGLLLSYGSDEDDEEPVSPQQQSKEEEKKLQHELQQPRQQQGQQENEQGHRQTQAQVDNALSASAAQAPPLKRKPPPPPPTLSLPPAAPAEAAADTPAAPSAAAGAVDDADDNAEEEAEDSEGEGDSDSNSKDLTAMWRSLRITRFALKKKKRQNISIEREEGPEEDIDTMMEALPDKPPWAQPNNKLGLSKASALAIQQLGHQLLAMGDLSLVQHAKTYEDDASPFPFLRTSSMDLRYFRYVLKCVEAEIKKEGFHKPQPLPGPTHELARSFMARLQLNHHLQQRKQKLLEECKRLSGETQENQGIDYLKRVEAAAAAAGTAVAANGVSKSSTGNLVTSTAEAAAAATATTPAVAAAPYNVGAAVAPAAAAEAEAATGAATAIVAADPSNTAYFAAAQGQLSPAAAAHLQMLVQQMAAASAADDAATYMACYTAYCYALATLPPEAAAAATAAAATTSTTTASMASTAAAAAAATTATAAITLAATPLDSEAAAETPNNVPP